MYKAVQKSTSFDLEAISGEYLKWPKITDGVYYKILWEQKDPFFRSAILVYIPGGKVGWHYHPAPEIITVLQGSQSDTNERYFAGSIILNPGGSEHEVWSEDGCIVSIHWNAPVEFKGKPN